MQRMRERGEKGPQRPRQNEPGMEREIQRDRAEERSQKGWNVGGVKGS